MEKFKLANGWTKERALRVLFAGNNGERAVGGITCKYLTSDGNKCAVGCFIPDGHPLQNMDLSVAHAAERYPEIIGMMPLSSSGMRKLQMAHDKARFSNKDVEEDDRFFKDYPLLDDARNEHEVFQLFFDYYVE